MLKIIWILFFISFAANAFELNVVDVKCIGVRSCREISKKFDDLKGNYPDEKSLKESIRFLLVDKTIKYFDYSLTVSEEAVGALSLTISEKEIVGKIKINFDRKLKIPELEQIIPLKTDTPFEDTQIEDCKVIITKFLTDKGIETESIEILKNVKDQIANFVINVKIKSMVFVRALDINFKEKNNEKWIKLKMLALKDKSYDKTQFKIILNEIKTKLQDLGYVNYSIETEEIRLTPESIQLNVNISLGHFVSFSFYGNSIINHESLSQESRKVIKSVVNIDSLNILDQSIRNLYIKKGLHLIGIKIRHEAIKKQNTEVMAHYIYVTINEGFKSKVSKLEFFGNNILPASDIEDLYYQNATELSDSGFYDEQYAKDFSAILSKKYISLGYNFVSIDEPKAICNKSDCVLTYLLNEKQQSFLNDFTVTGVPKALVDKYLPDLKNKINQPTNLVELDQDLGYLLRKIKDEGYYFSSYQSLLPKEILKFNNNYSEATLRLQIENAKMTKIAGVFISGNVKTLQDVIRRELDFKIGDTLTPEIVEQTLENINSTGLFSRVQVNPVIASDSNGDDILANIVINVQERDSVVLETGPGYRTDLGLKAKAGASLNNLMGMNRTISLISEANYRLTFDNLDSRRRTERSRITEFDIKASYTEPYFIPQIFGKAFDWQVGLSSSRKRFYGFDADINKFSNEFTKNITRKWSLSMRYQLESIEQSDATETKDQGYFRIGSVTPTLSFDLREPKVNSRKGALFSLSCEYATPSLGSKDRNDLEINYYKLISRNKFYIPIYKFVLASSVTVGQEKNLASDSLDDANNTRKTRGYIPGVKVFRLQGVDNVRGFSDNEINNVESINKDIGEILIEDTAYFVNTKVEPRYYMNDSSIVGLFFDAGRMFVNHFKPTKLRTSVGVSYKVLTPVGTLDFDYGMKIKRERNASDQEETFGRFQLAIGFF